MARNGSGIYSIPLTFTPHTDADAADVNQNFSDIGTALTGSVAADGQTTITGQMKGVVSATPCWSFNGDLNTGFGSDTADEAFIKCGGTEVARLTATGLDVPLLTQGGNKLVPTGAIMDYIGATAPGGWVLGNGGSIGNAASGATERDDADTEELFALIWNSADVANGEGQVQDSSGSNVARGASAAADYAANRRILLPDFRDRVARGKGAGTSLGETGGADSVTIAQAHLPNYTLPNTLGATTVAANTVVTAGNFTVPAGGAANVMVAGGAPDYVTTITGSVTSGGSGTALDVKPKFIVQTKIIKL